MSSTPSAASIKPKRVVVPKVWKRPHSTIYGKNVEFGSSLYSDKLGEINGRKFNSELPWQVRNSSSSSSGLGPSSSSQRYISSLLNSPENTLLGSVAVAPPPAGSGASGSGGGRCANVGDYPSSRLDSFANRCHNYSDLLDLTNPNRCSRRRFGLVRGGAANLDSGAGRPNKRIDFYDQYNVEFCKQIERFERDSLLRNEPLLTRRVFDKFLDFNYELGVFVPTAASGRETAFAPPNDGKSLLTKRTLINWEHANCANLADSYHSHSGGGCCTGAGGRPSNQSQLSLNSCHSSNACNSQFNPICSTATKQTALLPKHACQLASSPYGQSADGRKLSLGSINPHSYRPSLPQKSSTVHSSDGEEFEFHDKSSPFYTDRWAGKTIRHFDSDLYSNANLFKSMIL